MILVPIGTMTFAKLFTNGLHQMHMGQLYNPQDTTPYFCQWWTYKKTGATALHIDPTKPINCWYGISTQPMVQPFTQLFNAGLISQDAVNHINTLGLVYAGTVMPVSTYLPAQLLNQ